MPGCEALASTGSPIMPVLEGAEVNTVESNHVQSFAPQPNVRHRSLPLAARSRQTCRLGYGAGQAGCGISDLQVFRLELRHRSFLFVDACPAL